MESIDQEESSNPEAEIEIEAPKPVRLSLHLIQKRNIRNADKMNQDEIVSSLNHITHLRLDRENIGAIDGLELLGENVRNVYLQKNRITKIQNLECLKNLSFLTLAGNQITKIEGLSHFNKLLFLDLSENFIQDFDIDEIPQSLIILNLKDNPCTFLPDYRGRLIQELEGLKQLDGVEISKTEKREAGFHVSSSEEEDDDEEEEVMNRGQGDDVRSSRLNVDLTDTDEIKQKAELTSLANSILVRSQERTETALSSHLTHTKELDTIREESNLPASVRTYTPRASSRLGGKDRTSR